MTHDKDLIPTRRDFMLKTASVAAVAATGTLMACGDSTGPTADFLYGVASGDPLADRVILWTHAKAPDSVVPVPLTWQVATDKTFASVVATGRLEASEATGFTAKVDVTGLTAGTAYVYRFLQDGGQSSAVGSTRTLPASTASTVKLAVFSCSLFSNGYFNAYDAAAKSDAEYAIHLGDYLYEYGADPAKFGNTDAVNGTSAVSLGRVISPANDMVSLADYRTRHALYKSDLNLQALHARMPWITVWDDHEFANDAYMDGAENHNAATQGDWATRKAVAARVYHEWMPIRTHATGNQLKIYRSFNFGNLLSLHMLDTRIEGRDKQYSNFGDADGGTTRYLTGLATGTDAGRKMISTEQQAWLMSSVNASTAAWQFLGNQDIMARMWLPGSVLQAQNTAFAAPTPANQQAVGAAISAFLTAKATRAAAGASALSATQKALLSASSNPRIPYNLDSWDGYPSQRDTVLQAIKASGKRLVALSGDSHNAWFSNLTTLAGDKVGVEFAGASVTAPGFESAGLGGLAASLDGSVLSAQLGSAAIGTGLGLIDDLGYADTVRRGYLLMTVTSAAVKGEYVFVDTVKSKTYAVTVGKAITVSSAGAVTYA